MDESAIRIRREGSVGWITLNRPSQLNAVNDEMRLGLPLVLNELDEDPDIRVLIVRGAGERAFSVGADVKETRAPESPIEARQRLSRSSWIEAVAQMRKPTIASIHGFCLGGGLELALACDIRIAAQGSSFALPEVDLGLLPGGGGTQRLARLVGQGRALDMILTGERISAERALEIGLISRVAAMDTLENETAALATRLANKAPHALRLAKEAVKATMNVSLDEGLKIERNLFALLLSTEDRHEAANAFVEKRPARFSGR